ncbi:Aste57867_16997 [Aphanomyces stellatus]|uniref:Aste57867_16997 protein n=1 Tax=Aphanomyces stellatus TaxID=120398 RepID=A0A485L6R4_9STRA|nr:hypothetical protein As57867_016939 [Aphanomyces stellatus]VFT93758.1 Aste57867_16997 [Aphanomyces stellatus]
MGYDGFVEAVTPFIPPFMRVNAQTLEEIKTMCPSKRQLQGLLTWTTLRYTIYFAIWVYGLVLSGEGEMVTLYVIATLFVGIIVNLGDKDKDSVGVDEDGNAVPIPSAYSVFNARNQRLAGQLTTEHFEQQIRNRGPLHDDDDEEDALMPAGVPRNDTVADVDDDDDDADLREAIRRSLQDNTSTARRAKGKDRKKTKSRT